jgi:hypothetical protein
MFARLRRLRVVSLLLALASPAIGGTVLPALHPCPVDEPWLAAAHVAHSAHRAHGTAPDHAHAAGDGQHPTASTPSARATLAAAAAPAPHAHASHCHCISTCHSASALAAAATPSPSAALAAAPVVRLDATGALAHRIAPAHLLPFAIAPPLAA